MPELPEVEAIRTQLEKYLKGHTIEKVEVRNPRIFQGEAKNVEGSSFKDFRRFGKVLALDLDNEFSLVIHVKMTGQLIYRGPNLKDPQLSNKVAGGLGGAHTHVIFHLNNDGKLYYNDFRRFGWIKVIRTDDVGKEGLVGKMGPEPLKDLTLEHFEEVVRKTRRNIKVLLMDQSKIGGVGNIYANDALWLAKINPKRAANTLTDEEARLLYEAIEQVLKKGMEMGGSSENSYVRPDGSEGEYQNHTLVYGRQGTKCERCGTVIEKFMLGGRGTYVCLHCQR
jgi:formamidopyrimidine-DNA glycosylase